MTTNTNNVIHLHNPTNLQLKDWEEWLDHQRITGLVDPDFDLPTFPGYSVWNRTPNNQGSK